MLPRGANPRHADVQALQRLTSLGARSERGGGLGAQERAQWARNPLPLPLQAPDRVLAAPHLAAGSGAPSRRRRIGRYACSACPTNSPAVWAIQHTTPRDLAVYAGA